MPQDVRPTRLIALINQKGGVGKTTTTVNLAAAIAERGRRVLLIDLDPQAHATLHLGIDPAGEGRRTVYDLFVDEGPDASVDVQSTIVEARPNLDLIPSVVDLAAAEVELADVEDRNRILARRLAGILPRYEFVLLDCPPSLGVLTLNALSIAREVIVPLQAHFLALQGVGKLLETVGLVARSVNPSLRVTGVVLCMHEPNISHQKEVVADLDAFFEAARGTAVPWNTCRVLRPAIRRNIKLAEAPSFGKTIFDYEPWCPGALDYRALAERLVAEWDAMLARRETAANAEPKTARPKAATAKPTRTVATAVEATSTADGSGGAAG